MNAELEREHWTPYLTFLTAYIAMFTFFQIYSISYRAFVLDYWIIMLNITARDLFLLGALISIGALGGIGFVYLVDFVGRKKPLIIFFPISLFLNCISYYISYIPLFLTFRILGFVLAVNTTGLIISEEVPARYRSTTLGIVMFVGMCSSIVAAGQSIFFSLHPELWRFSFILVTIPGLLLIGGLGTQIKETRRFLQLKKNPPKEKKHLFPIFKKEYARNMILCTILIACVNLLYMTIKSYFKPFLLFERGWLFSSEVIGIVSMISYIGSIVGYFASGFLGDRIGRKKTIYMASGLYFVGSILFLFTFDAIIIFLGFVLVNALFAVLYVMTSVLAVEFFHTKERAIGSGWIVWFASFASIGGNFLMRFLSDVLPWGIIFFIIGTTSIVILCILPIFLPETKKRVLEEIFTTEIDRKAL